MIPENWWPYIAGFVVLCMLVLPALIPRNLFGGEKEGGEGE